MTLSIKEILREFVGYLESAANSGVRDPGSPFEMPVPARVLAQVEAALDLAQSSAEQVVLVTDHIPAQALIGAFVLQQTGLSTDRILTEFDEAIVTPLCIRLYHLSRSRLQMVEASSLPLPKPGASNVRYILLSAN